MKSIDGPLNGNIPKVLTSFFLAFRTAAKHIFNTLFILNVINEKKRVLNKERNNTYLAEASIFPRCTTACNLINTLS